ncbi:hypothetical protein EXIGLDRAFT_229053 [Exidia glandulosa HHB12029]|uniref:Uncharacterized protein n=1 Tax=Exidia glandulosa HHB12029 TaxID=1314781 RepID=A0A165ZWH4_EXIGL|nr:hypothetical protein EXIGLDRAFT_229053 [Exidia glandulosa HHB12029]
MHSQIGWQEFESILIIFPALNLEQHMTARACRFAPVLTDPRHLHDKLDIMRKRVAEVQSAIAAAKSSGSTPSSGRSGPSPPKTVAVDVDADAHLSRSFA